MMKHTFRDKKKTVAATIYARDDEDAATVAFSGDGNEVLTFLHRFDTLEDAIDAASEFCELDIHALHNHIHTHDAVPF
jgi:hypothetical protein